MKQLGPLSVEPQDLTTTLAGRGRFSRAENLIFLPTLSDSLNDIVPFHKVAKNPVALNNCT